MFSLTRLPIFRHSTQKWKTLLINELSNDTPSKQTTNPNNQIPTQLTNQTTNQNLIIVQILKLLRLVFGRFQVRIRAQDCLSWFSVLAVLRRNSSQVHRRLVKWQHSTGVSRLGMIKIQPCLGHGLSCRRFNVLLFSQSRRTLPQQTRTTIYRLFIIPYLTSITITGYYIAFVAETAALSDLKLLDAGSHVQLDWNIYIPFRENSANVHSSIIHISIPMTPICCRS